MVDKHTSYQEVEKYTLRWVTKSCVTAGVQNSIKIKNKLFKVYDKFFKNKLNDLKREGNQKLKSMNK